MALFYKICRICGVEKPIHHFCKNSYGKDGYRNVCAICTRIKANKLYKLDIEKSREYEKNRRKLWRKNNPEKSKESYRKSRATRKHFGFNPLNNWFLNSEGHHLHINNHDDIIYSPIELHKSIKHSYKDSLSMYKIKKIIFEWYWKELIIGDIQWL